MEPGTMIMYLLVIVVLLYVLRLLWAWLNGASDVQDMVIYESPTEGLSARPTSEVDQTFSGKKVPQIYPGGEYSISTWIYVRNWNEAGSTGQNKPFLLLSGGATGATAYSTLAMYLGKNTNKLGIRVSHNNPSATGVDAIRKVTRSAIVAGLTDYGDSDVPTGNCDIEQVDLQRWVCITVVMMGKTVDVYIDGKLSRTTVLSGSFEADGTVPTLVLGTTNGFGGLIGKTTAANTSYTPDRVYANYQQGPFSGFSLSSLDPSQYSLSLTKNNSVVFTTG